MLRIYFVPKLTTEKLKYFTKLSKRYSTLEVYYLCQNVSPKKSNFQKLSNFLKSTLHNSQKAKVGHFLLKLSKLILILQFSFAKDLFIIFQFDFQILIFKVLTFGSQKNAKTKFVKSEFLC